MKLQVALDRISSQQAIELAQQIKHVVDILEIGTSLIKDYGMGIVREIHRVVPDVTLLADIKTMDEGAYEFESAFAAGSHIATVMGVAPLATILACYDVTRKWKRDLMIDLLETDDTKMAQLNSLDQALYCIHLPKDEDQAKILVKVQQFYEHYPYINRVAVAGGITLHQIPALKRLPVEICVVGSEITQATNPYAKATAFRSIMQA